MYSCTVCVHTYVYIYDIHIYVYIYIFIYYIPDSNLSKTWDFEKVHPKQKLRIPEKKKKNMQLHPSGNTGSHMTRERLQFTA